MYERVHYIPARFCVMIRASTITGVHESASWFQIYVLKVCNCGLMLVVEKSVSHGYETGLNMH